MESESDLRGDLLSVAAVSTLLQVSQAQVHNLCRERELEKIDPPAGRKHHRAGAEVITRESVDKLLRGRSGETSNAALDSVEDRPIARDQAMAHEMKVRLDQARKDLRTQRQRTRAVLKLLHGAVEVLDAGIASEEAVDEIANGYSAALTHALTENDASSIDGAQPPTATGVLLHWTWG